MGSIASTQSDEDVVARIRAGDRALFEVLMRRHNQRIYRAVRAVLRDDAEAEDAMQAAYLSAFAHLEQFQGAARFSTWMTRIALNEAFARLRARRRVVNGEPIEEAVVTDGERSPEQAVAARELGALLEDAVDALPEIYRVVYVLREIQELSTAETADCLGLGEEAVKVRLHRARAALREALYRRVGEAEAFVFLGPRCDRLVASVLAKIS